ncbi:MAG: hypothetical protein MI861_24525 [Pirellulales bacterium]|nr:hypothetical protein [Pirellulales bacterium]
MRFGIQTMLVLMTAAALLGVMLTSVEVALGVMCLAIPVAIVVVGLTAPQKGTSLDVGSHKGFRNLIQLWGFLAAALVIFGLIIWAFPDLRDDLRRWARGDFRSHQFLLKTSFIPYSEVDWQQELPLVVYDDQGLVGEAYNVYMFADGRVTFVVSTDREGYSEGLILDSSVEVRGPGTVYFPTPRRR